MRFVLSFGRIALAVTLLVGVWLGTVKAVERGSRDAEQRRSSDRLAVAKGFAASVSDWLDAGRTEASSLSHGVAVAGPSEVLGDLNAFLAQPHPFSRDAIALSNGTVIAATGRYAALVGLPPHPCVRAGETESNLLAQLARTAAPAPVVSPIFDVPGACTPAVAVVASAGPYVTAVVGPLSDVEGRLVAGGKISDPSVVGARPSSDVPLGGTRILLVSPALNADPSAGVVSPPPYVAQLITDVAHGGAPVARETSGNAAVVAAVAPVRPGWSVVLEQDAALYDIPVQDRPAGIVATVLTISFAIVFAIVAFFDIRRRRAHRRAEVAKNAFFSIAGHELRTPLTVLNGFTEMLANNWENLDDERRRSLVDRMAPQARRLGRLVERLLVAASIQAETHVRPDMQDMDPAPVMRRVAEEFELESPLHSFIVKAPAGAQVLGDPAGFEEALRHLVENAVKYSPSGGRVWLRLVPDKRFVHVVVDDEGIGLPSDHSRIFDSFVQGESVTTRLHDEGGVGLGLFIVRTLIEEMGGTVLAERRDEGGARFVVSLRRGRVNPQVDGPKPELVRGVQSEKSRTRQKA